MSKKKFKTPDRPPAKNLDPDIEAEREVERAVKALHELPHVDKPEHERVYMMGRRFPPTGSDFGQLWREPVRSIR